MNNNEILNTVIVGHLDHGKSDPICRIFYDTVGITGSATRRSSPSVVAGPVRKGFRAM
jgi:translation elongation factor EF-1alpha